MPTNSHGELSFTHAIQVAHRLYRQEGKCQQIHGHSITVTLGLQILHFDEQGYALSDDMQLLEFGEVKKSFRRYLDDNYDHKLLLNKDDPWAGLLLQVKEIEPEGGRSVLVNDAQQLPGLVICDGDPSTENIAKWLASRFAEMFSCFTVVKVQETDTNAVVRTAYPSPRSSYDSES